MRNSKEILDKAYEQGWLSGFDFSVLMHRLLVSENGYVININAKTFQGKENAINAIQQALSSGLLYRKVPPHKPVLWHTQGISG